MLTAILRSETIAAFGLTYLLSIAMLIFPFLIMPLHHNADGLLYSHWAFGWLRDQAVLLPYVSVTILIAAALLMRIRTGESRKVLGSSNLSMLAFIAIIMVDHDILMRPDLLMATLLTSAIILLLLSIYKQESVLSRLFHVGLLLGITALFIGQGILLLLAIVLSVLILRSANVKEWAALLLGLGMTAVFILLFTIWAESPWLTFQRVIQSGWSVGRSFSHANAGHLLLIPVIIIPSWKMFNSLTMGTVAERTITLTLLVWVVCTFLAMLLLGIGWQNGLIVAAFPLSVLIGKALDGLKRWWLSDLILFLMLAAPFVSNLWQL